MNSAFLSLISADDARDDFAHVIAWFEHVKRQAPIACVQCGELVEEARKCYAHPTCYACLPPPIPLRRD